jgi:hypothetical protein
MRDVGSVDYKRHTIIPRGFISGNERTSNSSGSLESPSGQSSWSSVSFRIPKNSCEASSVASTVRRENSCAYGDDLTHVRYTLDIQWILTAAAMIGLFREILSGYGGVAPPRTLTFVLGIVVRAGCSGLTTAS